MELTNPIHDSGAHDLKLTWQQEKSSHRRRWRVTIGRNETLTPTITVTERIRWYEKGEELVEYRKHYHLAGAHRAETVDNVDEDETCHNISGQDQRFLPHGKLLVQQTQGRWNHILLLSLKLKVQTTRRSKFDGGKSKRIEADKFSTDAEESWDLSS